MSAITEAGLRESGKQIRKFKSRLAINQDRARAWIKAAHEEGLNDTELRAALGFSMAEFRQLIGTA